MAAVPTSSTSAAPRRQGAPARAGTAAELDYRPSHGAAAIAGLLVFLLYLLTLAPNTAMWDTSEYLAAAYVLGLPHPPGNPFFVLIGRMFAILPIPGTSVAARINILAALCSAISASMWFLITERVLVSWLARRWQRIAGGALAVVIGATAFTVWNQSVVNEKVYTVSLLGLAIVSWLTVRWCDFPDGRKADRILVLIAYLLSLGYTNHMGGMLAAPAVILAVLVRRPQTVFRWKLLVAVAGALVIGMTPFATQPIRAAHFPAINEGEPTGCEREIAVDCTFSRLTLERFEYNFNRGQYGKPSVLERQAPIGAQIGMWWLYFRWQWLRDADARQPGLQWALAAAFLMLGLAGGWVHFRRDQRSFWYFGSLMFTLTLLLIYYLNFKYGYSQAPDLGDDVPREVRDRDYFYLWSFSAWSVWAALGLVWVWESLAALFGADAVKLGKEVVEAPRRSSWIKASPVLALALVPLVGNWRAASRAGQTDTLAFAQDLLNSVEPYGVLVTVGDNDTFPLWYAQEVEGIRKDVVVANTSLMNTDWYVRQMIRRPVYEYDAAKGPAIYRGRAWTKPAGPPLKMSMADADRIPPYIEIREPQLFRKETPHGTLVATIRPEVRYLERADLVVLQMIKDAFPERPMYVSRTAGSYGEQLGLTPYLLTQGLARKLLPAPPRAGRDTVMSGEGWLDLATSLKLWQSEFQGPQAVEKRGSWVDRASVGIPMLYVATAAVLADALQQSGRAAEAQQMIQQGQRVAQAVGAGQLFAPRSGAEPVPLPSGDTARAP